MIFSDFLKILTKKLGLELLYMLKKAIARNLKRYIEIEIIAFCFS